MRNPVACFLRLSWIILLVGIVLAVAGDRLGWASRTRAPNMVSPAAADLAALDPAGGAPALSMPEPGPQVPGPPMTLQVTLVGTAVVEGGPSFAVFEGAKGSRLVREGEEIAPGVLLLQVDWSSVEVGRGGIRQEIRLGSSDGTPAGLRLGSSERIRGDMRVSAIGGRQARSEAASAAARRLREIRGQTFLQRGQEMRGQ